MSAKKEKYADIIFPGKEAAKKEKVEDAVEEANIAILTSVAVANKAKRQAASKLKTAKRSVPFRPDVIVQAQAELAKAEETLNAYKAIQAEMF